ncbi:tyrosine-type recombinase/integrase [Companilactobacillus sp. DQM5]|uniref:tyrosine-type recombinase/integrase n=1 Tax=Companilactobacillus sp. DQM5 TaxID=3463359 RepID=UPI004058E81F
MSKDKRIKTYTKKDGSTAYKFQIYLGIDEKTGKKKRTTRSNFKSIKEAEKALKILDYKVVTNSFETKHSKENITFEDVYEEWYLSYIHTVRESTYSRTRGMFSNHILPEFGKYRIKMISTEQCQKSLNKWYEQTEVNYKKWFNYVKAVFSYAERQEYVIKNPAQKIIMPKKYGHGGNKKPNFWSKEQLKTFFDYIDPQKELEKYTLFRLLAFTGIRRGECLALKWRDLDFNEKTLNINTTLTQGIRGRQIEQPTKTKKGNRIIFIDEITLNYLKKWQIKQRKDFLMMGFNVNKDNQLIFSTRNNTHKSLNTPAKWLESIIKKSNLPKISVHGFRHSHASALFSAGASIKEVQDRLGHDDVKTTLNIYTHITEKQSKEVVDKVVNYLDF